MINLSVSVYLLKGKWDGLGAGVMLCKLLKVIEVIAV
ncbi:hypothetical protein APED_29595 [Acanthopleuribacter pedis]